MSKNGLASLDFRPTLLLRPALTHEFDMSAVRNHLKIPEDEHLFFNETRPEIDIQLSAKNIVL